MGHGLNVFASTYHDKILEGNLHLENSGSANFGRSLN